MCGIFAYLNYRVPRERRLILEILFNGLRRLEHRGYDSAGISVDSDPEVVVSFASDKNGLVESKKGEPTDGIVTAVSSRPLVFRREGKIEKLVTSVYQEADESDLDLEYSFDTHAGIAHTRWATHGVPSKKNAHPQSSGEGNEFVVVHNGVVTNHTVLKETLVQHGFNLRNDTEVIPKFAKFVYDQLSEGGGKVSFTQVVMEVLRKLEGPYALIFKSPLYPNELVACNRVSPLLLGVKQAGLEEECCMLTMMCSLPKLRGNQRTISWMVVILSLNLIRTTSPRDYMQKEIYEQPESLTTTIRGRLTREMIPDRKEFF